MVHTALWFGDILALYAMCAPLVLLLRKLPARVLADVGVALVGTAIAPFFQSAVGGDSAEFGGFWFADADAILVALSSAPDDTMRLTELAEAANLSQSRLTHRLKTMTERGDVEITADEDDGRAKNATLTRSGRRLLERVAPIHAEDVQRLVFDHLDAGDTEALARALSKVAHTLCGHEAFSSTDE